MVRPTYARLAGAALLACLESISHLLLCSLLDGSHDDIFKVSINCGLVNLNNLTKQSITKVRLRVVFNEP